MSMTLCFLPDGTVQGTYAELIDLSCLGWLKVQRLSAIEFDNSAQLWRIYDRKGRCVHSSASRNDCLRWEQELLVPPGDNQAAS
jgi:hypothetical protein